MEDVFELLALAASVAVEAKLPAAGPLLEPVAGIALLSEPISRQRADLRTDNELWRPMPMRGDELEPGWPHSWRLARCTPGLIVRTVEKRTVYRGACWGCGWMGPERSRKRMDFDDHAEFEAVGDAHDHTHPGWRELPAVHRPTKANSYFGRTEVIRWGRKIAARYPAGWFESGGPVLTMRTGKWEMRQAKAGHAPGGGYDLPGLLVPERRRPEAVADLVMLFDRPKRVRKRNQYGSLTGPSGDDSDHYVFDLETQKVMKVGDVRRRGQARVEAARRWVIARKETVGDETRVLAWTSDGDWTHESEEARVYTNAEKVKAARRWNGSRYVEAEADEGTLEVLAEGAKWVEVTGRTDGAGSEDGDVDDDDDG